jgi:cytochrome c-type biogenesis protein CcmH/NrfG
VKRETLITALVFFVLGSIAGYVYRAQSSTSEVRLSDAGGGAAAATDGSSASAGTGDAASGQGSSATALPPGHPAISDPVVIQTFTQQAAQNPQDPGPPLQLANYLYDHGDYAQAITWYQKATALDPTNINASTDLGTCYFNLGRFDEALKQFRQSLTIDPRHQPTLYNLVVVNMEGRHDYKAAEQAWQTLHGLNPNYPNLDQLKQKLDQARN